MAADTDTIVPCPPHPWTFALVTLGCKVNQYESQALREAWSALGGIETDSAHADISLINSCAITARAERETRNALYRLVRENPHGKRILTGCSALLVEASLQHIEGRKNSSMQVIQDFGVPVFHAVVAAPQKYRLLQGPWPALQGHGDEGIAHKTAPKTDHSAGQTPAQQHPPYPAFSISTYHRARPVLKVQDGCSHRCTYCIVPLVRGAATSRSPHEVLAEARRVLQAGHCEIMLSGINLAQYGKNSPEYGNFWQLLQLLEKELAPEWVGRARFRISSLEPGQLDAQGIEALLSCSMLCPHLHISLQSGSDAVLKRMGRGHYRVQQLVDGITGIQKYWPRMGLGADILMGFPGEEATHVQETLDIINTLPMTYAHVFPYSRRPQTAAADFAGQIPHHEKLRRAALVREAVHHKQQAFLHTLLEVPLTHVVLDGATARKGINEFYAPCRMASPHQGLTGIVQAKALRVEKDALVVEI